MNCKFEVFPVIKDVSWVEDFTKTDFSDPRWYPKDALIRSFEFWMDEPGILNENPEDDFGICNPSALIQRLVEYLYIFTHGYAINQTPLEDLGMMPYYVTPLDIDHIYIQAGEDDELYMVVRGIGYYGYIHKGDSDVTYQAIPIRYIITGDKEYEV